VLVITRDPPACAQCVSFDFKVWGGIPLTGVLCLLANIPVLFVSCLIPDKLYSKLERLLGLQVVGLEVIASVVFKSCLGLVEEDRAFDVVGEIVYRTAVNMCGVFHLKVEGDCSS
jgi:hypothetical protein